MKIKIKTSKEYSEQMNLIGFIILLLVPFFIFGITKVSSPDVTFLGAFSSLYNMLASDGEYFLAIVMPLAWVFGLINMLVQYISSKKKPEDKEFSEIYMDNQGVRFIKIINKQKCFLNYSYAELGNLDVNISTRLIHTKNGTQLAIERIDLFFEVLSDNKIIKINLYGDINNLYKILAFHKRFKNFTYEIDGPSESLPEKIEFFKQKGKREFISNKSRGNMQIVGIVIFATGVYFAIMFKDMIKEIWGAGIFPIGLMLIAVVIFVMLELDRRAKN